MTDRFSLCESAKANKRATKNLINALSFDGLNIIKMTLGLIGAEKAV